VKSGTPAPSAIQVQTGLGMKEIDSPVNDFGVELRNMEKLNDISAGRQAELQADPWWLYPRADVPQWQTQFRLDLGLDQKLRAREVGHLLGQEAQIEGGFHYDHRRIIYMSNNRNPTDSSGNHLDSYPSRRDGGYLKLLLNSSPAPLTWSGLSDLDFRTEDVYAGPRQIGDKTLVQTSLNGKVQVQDWTFVPFGQFRKGSFRSNISPLYATRDSGWKLGLQTEKELWNRINLIASISRESFVRDRDYGASAAFHRDFAKLNLKYSNQKLKWIELDTHLFFEMANDEVDAVPSEFAALWDGGIDLSSPRTYTVGWELKGRRFALMPTTSQRFGDGALLQGSPDLPLETGYRGSTGPWWHAGPYTLSAAIFAEESVNSPIMVANSATSVHTIPVGGVWTQGFEVHGQVEWSHFSIRPSFSYQDAVNSSQINWQTGQAVPGRPKFVTRAEFEYELKDFRVGARYSYKSADALDLSGLWFQPPQHVFDTWIAYGKRNWEVRLLANNLVPTFALPENLTFQGSAAPNLLEPNFAQRDIRLQCEVLL
jgi:hypothetical protein